MAHFILDWLSLNKQTAQTLEITTSTSDVVELRGRKAIYLHATVSSHREGLQSTSYRLNSIQNEDKLISTFEQENRSKNVKVKMVRLR